AAPSRLPARVSGCRRDRASRRRGPAAGARTPPAPAWRGRGHARAPSPARSPPRSDRRRRGPPPAPARGAPPRGDGRRETPWSALRGGREYDVGDLDDPVPERRTRLEPVADGA